MRVRATTIPPCSAIAPPLSPVPAPRATTGTPCFPAVFTTPETSSVVRGKHDDRRQRTVDGAVVLEDDQVLGLVDYVRLADDFDEITDEVGVAHGLIAP